MIKDFTQRSDYTGFTGYSDDLNINDNQNEMSAQQATLGQNIETRS